MREGGTQFAYVSDFAGDFAAVIGVDGKAGVVDRRLRLVVPMEFVPRVEHTVDTPHIRYLPPVSAACTGPDGGADAVVSVKGRDGLGLWRVGEGRLVVPTEYDAISICGSTTQSGAGFFARTCRTRCGRPMYGARRFDGGEILPCVFDEVFLVGEKDRYGSITRYDVVRGVPQEIVGHFVCFKSGGMYGLARTDGRVFAMPEFAHFQFDRTQGIVRCVKSDESSVMVDMRTGETRGRLPHGTQEISRFTDDGREIRLLGVREQDDRVRIVHPQVFDGAGGQIDGLVLCCGQATGRHPVAAVQDGNDAMYLAVRALPGGGLETGRVRATDMGISYVPFTREYGELSGMMQTGGCQLLLFRDGDGLVNVARVSSERGLEPVRRGRRECGLVPRNREMMFTTGVDGSLEVFGSDCTTVMSGQYARLRFAGGVVDGGKEYALERHDGKCDVVRLSADAAGTSRTVHVATLPAWPSRVGYSTKEGAPLYLVRGMSRATVARALAKRNPPTDAPTLAEAQAARAALERERAGMVEQSRAAGTFDSI